MNEQNVMEKVEPLTEGYRAKSGPMPSLPSGGSAAESPISLADKKLAKELREEAGMLLSQLCLVMDRATKAGLVMAFQVRPDQRGLHQPSSISITRAL